MRIVAVEPAACPSLTRGRYAYDFGDTGHMTPLAKMHTLGSTFMPRASTPAVCVTTAWRLVSHIRQLGLIFLAGDRLSAADLAGAAHLSTNDYFGFVPWAEFPEVNAWYQRMKSRPSMRPLLADRIDGSPPAPHYADLDF